MQSIVIAICWAEIAALVVGAVMAIVSDGHGDAAGRALGTGYLVIGVLVLLLFFILPSMLLASTGRALWLAVGLAGIAALPAIVLGIGSVVGLAETSWKKLRRR